MKTRYTILFSIILAVVLSSEVDSQTLSYNPSKLMEKYQRFIDVSDKYGKDSVNKVIKECFIETSKTDLNDKIMVEVLLKDANSSLDFSKYSKSFRKASRYVLVELGADELAKLSFENEVEFIRDITKVKLDENEPNQAFVGMGGQLAHMPGEGYKGSGLKVAIIDGEWEGWPNWNGITQGELPPLNKITPIDKTFPHIFGNSSGKHGIACLETIYDFLPEANYVLYEIDGGATWAGDIILSLQDIRDNQQVDILSCSYSMQNFEGDIATGVGNEINNLINQLTEQGTVCFFSAGNFAQLHIYFESISTNSIPDLEVVNDYLIFSDSKNYYSHNFDIDKKIELILQWNETGNNWGLNFQLELYKFENGTESYITGSQSLNTYSVKLLYSSFLSNVEYRLKIKKLGNNPIQNGFFCNLTDFKETWTFNNLSNAKFLRQYNSIQFPALCQNAIAVGAVNLADRQEYYSSCGSANRNYIKPEFVAYSNFNNFSNGGSFSGTSASCPALAGLAGQIIQKYNITKTSSRRNTLITKLKDISKIFPTTNLVEEFAFPDQFLESQYLNNNSSEGNYQFGYGLPIFQRSLSTDFTDNYEPDNEIGLAKSLDFTLIQKSWHYLSVSYNSSQLRTLHNIEDVDLIKLSLERLENNRIRYIHLKSLDEENLLIELYCKLGNQDLKLLYSNNNFWVNSYEYVDTYLGYYANQPVNDLFYPIIIPVPVTIPNSEFYIKVKPRSGENYSFPIYYRIGFIDDKENNSITEADIDISFAEGNITTRLTPNALNSKNGIALLKTTVVSTGIENYYSNDLSAGVPGTNNAVIKGMQIPIPNISEQYTITVYPFTGTPKTISVTPSSVSLSNGNVSPVSGWPSDQYTFSVLYKHSGNQPPDPGLIKVVIDDDPSKTFTLQKDPNNSDYISGVSYSYISSPGVFDYGTGSVKSHKYKFTCSVNGNPITPEPSAGYLYFEVKNPNQRSVTLSFSQNPAYQHQEITVSAQLNPPTPNYPIKFFQDHNYGVFMLNNPVMTNSQGIATVNYYPTQTGSVNIIAEDGNSSSVYSLKKLNIAEPIGNPVSIIITHIRDGIVNNKVQYEIKINVSLNGQPYHNYLATFITDFGTWENGQTTYTKDAEDYTISTPLTCPSNGTASISVKIEATTATYILPIQYSIPSLEAVKIINAPGILSLSCSPVDDKIAYSSEDNFIRIYDISEENVTETFLYTVDGNPVNVNVLRYNPAGTQLFAASNYDVKILSSTGGNVIAVNSGVRFGVDPNSEGDAAWLYNSRILISSPEPWAKNLVLRYNTLTTMSTIFNDALHYNGSISVKGDTALMSFTHYPQNDGSSFLFDKSSMQQIWSFNPPGNGSHLANAISPNCLRVAISDDNDPCIYLLNTPTASLIGLLSDNSMAYHLDWNPINNDYLAALQGNGLAFWNTNNRVLYSKDNSCNSDYQNEGYWTPDGNIFALTHGGELRLYAPFDNENPVISLISPSNNTHTLQSTILLSGMAADNKGVKSIKYKINEGVWSNLPFNTSNQFTAQLSLTIGANTLKIRAMDVSARVTETIVTIYRDELIAPAKVILSEPADNSVNQPTSLVAKWLSTSTTTAYLFQLSSDSLFTNLIFNDSTVVDTVMQLNGLANSSRYFWRVCSRNGNIFGEMSNIRRFNTIQLPPFIPTLIYPIQGSIITANSVELKWRSSVRAERYHLEIATDSNFTILIVNDSLLTDTSFVCLSPSTGYFYLWRVRAINSGGTSDWSEIFSFRTNLIQKVPITEGWNLVSVPLKVQNSTPNFLYPNSTSQAYGFQEGYQIKMNLENGKGYWIKYSNNDTIEFRGEKLLGNSIPVSSGWNIIGVYDNPLSISGITTTPASILTSFFFGFNSEYIIPSVLEVGKGYWIRSNQNGFVNLNPTLLAKEGNQMVLPKIDPNWSKLIFSDKLSRERTLYISNDLSDTEFFDLPPEPPEGIFDVRFYGDKIVENLTESKQIIFKGCQYPVKIKILGKDVEIKDGIGGKLLNQSLFNGEEMTISNPEVTMIVIENIQPPEEFILSQNYPNPFNPSTVIRYQLPVNSKVSLKLYDILGREVTTLVDKAQESGKYEVTFDASGFSSGIYFYELRAGEFRSVKKLVLMK